MTADVVLDRLYQATHTIPRGSDSQKSGHCPAHDDRNASLSIRLLSDRVLLKCHAMCSIDDILAALGLTEADLFNQPLEQAGRPARSAARTWMPCTRDGHQWVAEYPYTDEVGTIEYGVTRCDRKCFRQWRVDLDTKSGRRWKLTDEHGALLVRPRLYRLPEVIEAVQLGNVVWVVEGEKDVHSLADRGHTATCNSGGAGKWSAEHHSPYLRGADVTIVADRDEAGRKHAERVVADLMNVARSIYVVQAAAGKDASDHFAAGGTSATFLQVWAPLPFPGDESVGAP